MICQNRNAIRIKEWAIQMVRRMHRRIVWEQKIVYGNGGVYAIPYDPVAHEQSFFWDFKGKRLSFVLESFQKTWYAWNSKQYYTKLAHVKNEFLNLPVPSHKSIDALSEDRNPILITPLKLCKKNAANKTKSHYTNPSTSPSKSTSNIHSPSTINTPLPARMPLMGFVNIPKKVMDRMAYTAQRSAFPLAHAQLQPLLQHYYIIISFSSFIPFSILTLIRFFCLILFRYMFLFSPNVCILLVIALWNPS